MTQAETASHTAFMDSDRVQGIPVYGEDRRRIGAIERLLIEKAGGQIALHPGFGLKFAASRDSLEEACLQYGAERLRSRNQRSGVAERSKHFAPGGG